MGKPKSLKDKLKAKKEIYDNFEIVKLTDSLTFLCAELGPTDPLVQKVLAGKSPRDRAAELVKGTSLKSVEVRKKLYEGDTKTIEARIASANQNASLNFLTPVLTLSTDPSEFLIGPASTYSSVSDLWYVSWSRGGKIVGATFVGPDVADFRVVRE